MIWRVVRRYAELARRAPTVSASVTHAMFDGLFLQALPGYLSGRDDAVADLRADARDMLASLVADRTN